MIHKMLRNKRTPGKKAASSEDGKAAVKKLPLCTPPRGVLNALARAGDGPQEEDMVVATGAGE